MSFTKTIFGFLFSVLVLSNTLLAKDLNIIAGSENAYKPFAYLDEQNNATGFDNEVLKALAAHIEGAKLQIISLPWNALFTGLDSARFDLIANQITKNKEREAKYIFSSKPYFYDISTLISLKSLNIKDIKELKNAKIGVTVGSNHAENLEKYVKENPAQNLQVVYYKSSPALVSDLANKRIDATVNAPARAIDYAKSENIEVVISDTPFEKAPVYLVFRKDSQELKKILDEALEKALNDGTLAKLSLEYFGVDLTK